MGERAFQSRQGGAGVAAHQGQFDRGRDQRDSARHHRQAYPGAAGDVSGSPDRSDEHTSELQSLMRISYAVFCLKKKTTLRITKTSSLSIQSCTRYSATVD